MKIDIVINCRSEDIFICMVCKTYVCMYFNVGSILMLSLLHSVCDWKDPQSYNCRAHERGYSDTRHCQNLNVKLRSKSEDPM